MNRNMLLVGVAGFATGAVAGSLITFYVSYKKLEAQAQLAIEEEVENRGEAARVFYKEKYDRLAQQNKVGPYQSPTDAVEKLGRKAVEAVLADPEDEQEGPPVNGRPRTDYRQYSKPLTHTDDDSRADPVIKEVPPAQRRPRDEHGRFVSQPKQDSQPEDEGVVVKISEDDYLANYYEFEQRRLVWYHEHDVLMDPETQTEIDVEVVGGEAMMQRFDFTIPEGEKNEICVRNTRLEEEYVIELSVEDLNEAMDALQD